MSPRVRLSALALAAFVVYGGWAAVANHGHGARLAFRALVTQGSSSALTTLLIGGLVELLRRRIPGGAAAVLAASVTAAFHVVVHLLAGTPEVARTVAPSMVVGYVFAAAYAAGTRRGRAALAV